MNVSQIAIQSGKKMFSLGVPFMATFPYSSAVWARVE